MGRLGVLIGVLLTTLVVFSGAGAAATPGAASGNQLHVAVPALVKAQVVYDITLTGTSLQHATLHLFVDYAGCARTFAAEQRRASRSSDTYHVAGAFEELSGWRSSSPGTDHACAYLLSRAGALLAGRRVAFRIR